MKAAFVICSRADSRRVPKKPFRKLNGTPLIEHLIERCLACELPVHLAIPHRDYEAYKYLKDKYAGRRFHLFTGFGTDPLKRMATIAANEGLDAVIRVCHDKVFIEQKAVERVLESYSFGYAEYAYPSNAVAGTGFEVISAAALQRATARFKDVEHVSYAIRCVTDKILDVDLSFLWRSGHRLLVDYEEDVRVLDLLLHSAGNGCSLDEAIRFMDQHNWLSRINRQPLVSVYTCAKDAERWITKAMGSVAQQDCFRTMEYILIDDGSKDATPILMSKFCDRFPNARWIRNPKNVGLSSSCNIALEEARGRYIVRLDADDYFVGDDAIRKLFDKAEASAADIVYPDNYYGDFQTVQKGIEQRHLGGALVRTRAANHIRFTEGLLGYEGLDFWQRAKDQLKVSYLESPIFFYRQHDKSLSKNNLEERAKIKAAIEGTAGVL